MKYTLKEHHQRLIERHGLDARAHVTAGELVDLLEELEQLRRLATNEPVMEAIIPEKRIQLTYNNTPG